MDAAQWNRASVRAGRSRRTTVRFTLRVERWAGEINPHRLARSPIRRAPPRLQPLRQAAPASAPQSGWKTQSTPAVDEKPNTVNSPRASRDRRLRVRSLVSPATKRCRGSPHDRAPDKVGAWVNSAIDSAAMGGTDYLQGKLNENLGGS